MKTVALEQSSKLTRSLAVVMLKFPYGIPGDTYINSVVLSGS